MIDRKCKVLHIFSGYGGGISSLIINLIENKTDDFEFDVMAFSFQNGEQFLNRLEKAGSKAYEMPRPRIDGYKAFNVYVDKVLAENRYEAIHCHITGWSMIPFYRLAKKAGIKNFFLHAHTTRYDRKFDRIFPVSQINKFINYICSDAFFTCSDLAAEYIYGQYLKRRNAILIPNGIAKEKFVNDLTVEEREAYRQEFGIERNEVIIMHVGRFSTAKNHDFILMFVEKLREKQEHVKLLFVGDGELIDDIKRKTREKNLEDCILFLGRRLDISSLMQLCNIMILPSYYEGLPTVAIECQASGTPMLLASHITRQCDMGLGLLSFLSIENMDEWISAFRYRRGKMDRTIALEAVEKQGFTSAVAGKEYCRVLRTLIAAKGD